jgi:diguanylate cyclase (GGDEF)-like protein
VVTGSYNDETRQALFKRKVADYVLKDGLSSIRYAVQTAYTIHQNSQRDVWLLSSGSKTSSKLLGMLRIHHFQASLYENCHVLHEALKNKTPDLILLDVCEGSSSTEFYGFVNKTRLQYSQNQLPMMSCAPSQNIAAAIKLMKYGVNDFYNTCFTAEEFYVRVSQNIQQAESFCEIERISQTDALTGIFNRGHFFNAGNALFEQLKSTQKYFFTVMADIDHFKLVNDNHGHQKGDDAIVYTAQQIQQTFSNYLVARFGGEEFCILGQVEDASEIDALCETLRATIENDALNATGVSFTISLGLTYSGKDLEEAVSKADKALYQSKESGRNRVSTEF